MKVLKFGGTSMGDEHTWRQILSIIRRYEHPVVVVSATARTTRQLVAAAGLAPEKLGEALTIAENIRNRHQTLVQQFIAENGKRNAEEAKQQCADWIDQCIDTLSRHLHEINDTGSLGPARKDAISSIGEQLSAYLFARCGYAFGLHTRWVDACDVIHTDDAYGQAAPDRSRISQNKHHLDKAINKNQVPVMGGFYGSAPDGSVTTLGFEGSDYTASLIGAALGAEAVEIWTDVSGIYTCDPRVVDGARPIPELSFREATELAYFGAKVLHPSTMKPASSANIPVFVKNIFEPEHAGTKIHGGRTQNGIVKALTYLTDIVIITVTAPPEQEGHRFLAEVFAALDRHKRAVNAVTTTEASVSVALQDDEGLGSLIEKLNSTGTVELQRNRGLISLIGCNFDDAGTIRDRVFAGIAEDEPALFSYSMSKRNLNIAVRETVLIPAVCRIHRLLFEEQ